MSEERCAYVYRAIKMTPGGIEDVRCPYTKREHPMPTHAYVPPRSGNGGEGA